MFRRLDQWVIENVIEPASHRLDWWFGVTRETLAKILQPFGAKGMANPFKHFGLYVFMRNTSLLVFTPMDIVAIVSGNVTPRLFAGMAFNIFLYVMACENAPPKPRTVPQQARMTA